MKKPDQDAPIPRSPNRIPRGGGLTPKQVAVRLGATEEDVRESIEAGKIPVLEDGTIAPDVAETVQFELTIYLTLIPGTVSVEPG